MLDDSGSDEDLEGHPKKKLKTLDDNSFQSFGENSSLSHSVSLNEKKKGSNIESNQNDNDTNEMYSYINFISHNTNDNQSGSSEESDSDNVNKFESDSDDEYVPISDGEFELEKFVDDKSNCKASDSKKKDDVMMLNELVTDFELKDSIPSKDPANNYDSLGIDNDEVYDLLDEAYQDKNCNSNENNKKTVTPDDFKEYEKVVLEEVCKNHFDILPENWIEATHKSGMPIYLHKKSRVVLLSRPYFLGPGDCTSHLAPLSAISCLQYQKGLESKQNLTNEPDFQASKLGDMIIPNAKVETAQENILKESLTHEELREYCQSLFK